MKRLFLLLLFLLLSISASAQTRISGYVEKGGNTIVTSGVTSTTKVQKSFPSSTVTVFLSGTTTLATIYADSSGTPKSNPFTADSSGFYYFYVANSVSTIDIRFSGVGIVSPWTVSTPIPVQSDDPRVNQFFNVKFYGAKGDGVTDDTVAIRTALAAADAAKGSLYFPAGSYVVGATSGTEVFLFHKGIKIVGDGAGVSLLKVKSTTGNIPVFRFKPLTNGIDERGFQMHDLGFQHLTGTGGGSCLVLDSTSAVIANFDISDNYFGLTQNFSVAVNNTNPDGVFTGTFNNNIFGEGLFLDNAGDTISIINGVITGDRGLYVNLVAGATTLNVIGVNITSKQMVQIYNGLVINFIGCTFETVQSGSGVAGAMVYMTGSTALKHVNFIGNNFGSINGNSLDGVRVFNNVQYVSFEANQFNNPAGKYGIKVDGAGVTNTWVGLTNEQLGLGGLSNNTTDPTYRSPLPFAANGAVVFRTGTGDPNGSVVGSPPDVYLNVSGGAGATLCIKESGVGTNLGWVCK